MSANRKLYKLERFNNEIKIYKLKIVGCIATIDRKGVLTKGAGLKSLIVPKYIISESIALLKADDLELERGYTYSGQSINIGWQR